MSFVMVLSNLIIPSVFLIIIVYGILKKVKIYDVFIDGAKDGFQTVLTIMPTLIALMISIGILRASGALEAFTSLLTPIAAMIGFPEEALPLTFMRTVSSAAATGLLLDIYQNYGPDSFTGRFVSVMMSSTETIFYTLSLYFMAVKITKTRYTLAGALIANAAGVIASLFITEMVFGR